MLFLRLVGAGAFGTLLVHAAPSNLQQATHAKCRLIPGDATWPQQCSWDRLNQTVDGKLIKTVPIGSVCHAPTYDEAACTKLRHDWGLAALVIPKPAEFMSTWFQNSSCTPFDPPFTNCDLGNYASYSIDVRSAQDARSGIEYARRHNLRLVVKNSGHDFYGKSTGKGALSLWVHNLDSKRVLNYTSPSYSGPAVQVGAGVEGGDAAAFAAEHGYRVVVGACPTVKAAGGFSQGGGHSFLSGKYGLGADNVLEWEAVTADGDHVTATPHNEHSDLYWALSGGGGGSFAVVLSMTMRAFPDGDIAIASMEVNVTNAGSVENYWRAVEAYQSALRPLVDQGFVAEYMITNESLRLYGLMAPDHTSGSLHAALKPLISALRGSGPSALNVQSMGLKLTHRKTYHDLYAATIQPLMEGNTFAPAVAGRFLPRSVIDNDSANWNKALREALTSHGGRFFASCTTLNARNSQKAVAPNSVQPNFRDAFSSIIITPRWTNESPWSEAAGLVHELEESVMPILEAATPGAGAYKNEASWTQKKFQEAFYAGTYPRLSHIKAKYDPRGVFYGLTAVGSEKWTTDAEGRLCRA